MRISFRCLKLLLLLGLTLLLRRDDSAAVAWKISPKTAPPIFLDVPPLTTVPELFDFIAPHISAVTSRATWGAQLRLRWAFITPDPEATTALYDKLESLVTAGWREADVSPWLTPILRSTRLQRVGNGVTVELVATPDAWHGAIEHFTRAE